MFSLRKLWAARKMRKALTTDGGGLVEAVQRADLKEVKMALQSGDLAKIAGALKLGEDDLKATSLQLWEVMGENQKSLVEAAAPKHRRGRLVLGGYIALAVVIGAGFVLLGLHDMVLGACFVIGGLILEMIALLWS